MTWYDLIPVFGAVVTIAGISFKAGQILQKLDHNTEDINRVIILETKMAGSNQKNA